MKLIFAQGNPEPKFAATRHNIGFRVLDQIADDNGARWAEKAKLQAFLAEIDVAGQKVILAKPTTFYNDTGIALKKLVDYYKITSDDLLIIHDDLMLPFGTVRVRKQGGDAGNNGIKSINQYIDHDYTRIKIGIYNDLRERMDDSDFVLAKFSTAEQQQLNDNVIPHVIKLIGDFSNGIIELTSAKTVE